MDAFHNNSKDAKETRQKEIEDLKQTQQKHRNEKLVRQDELGKKGAQELARLAQERENREKQLKSQIDDLKN